MRIACRGKPRPRRAYFRRAAQSRRGGGVPHPTHARRWRELFPTAPVVPPAPPPDRRAAPNPRRGTLNHKGVRAGSISLRPPECGRLLLRRHLVRPMPRHAISLNGACSGPAISTMPLRGAASATSATIGDTSSGDRLEQARRSLIMFPSALKSAMAPRNSRNWVARMASLRPSPVMVSTPLLGEAATTSWPPWRRMATVFEPIRPVPPMTTLPDAGRGCQTPAATFISPASSS